MLRIALLATAGAVALAGAASAADLPPPAPPPPPLYSWTGFYAGINAGGHWTNSTLAYSATDTSSLEAGGGLGVSQAFGMIPTSGVSKFGGFIGGGQIGYNYQLDKFVLGLEVDFDGATGRGSSSAVLTNPAFSLLPDFVPPPITTQSSMSLNWLGTVRGRLGWTPVDRLLVYATGGLAFGQSKASFSVFNAFADPVLAGYASSKKSIGWTVGGGLEYALPDAFSNWTIKVEYLYYDLGYTNSTVYYQNFDAFDQAEFSSLSGRVRHNGNIVRAGLNYKFDFGAPAPVVAKY